MSEREEEIEVLSDLRARLLGQWCELDALGEDVLATNMRRRIAAVDRIGARLGWGVPPFDYVRVATADSGGTEAGR